MRTGADKEVTKRIADHIENELKEGTTTTEIYAHAFDLLSKILVRRRTNILCVAPS